MRGLLEGSGLDDTQRAPRSWHTARGLPEHPHCLSLVQTSLVSEHDEPPGHQPVLLASPPTTHSSNQSQQARERPAPRSGGAQTRGRLTLSVCAAVTTW